MRTYQWIEELLGDLEVFSDLNDLPLLCDAVNRARDVFRAEAVSLATRGNILALNVPLPCQREPERLQLKMSGEVIQLFNSVADQP